MMVQSSSGGGEIEVPNGVYIQDTDGVLWQEAAWDGSATPNGIAVVADECRFVIALDEEPSICIDRVGDYVSLSLSVFSTSSEAIADYSGKSNTEVITQVYGYDTNEAGGFCVNFEFPAGEQGYLGAAGEWEIARVNKLEIEKCMTKAGGITLEGNYEYWSSTRAKDYSYPQYNIGPFNCFWRLNWNRQVWSDRTADDCPVNAIARPFTELGDVTGIVEA